MSSSLCNARLATGKLCTHWQRYADGKCGQHTAHRDEQKYPEKPHPQPKLKERKVLEYKKDHDGDAIMTDASAMIAPVNVQNIFNDFFGR